MKTRILLSTLLWSCTSLSQAAELYLHGGIGPSVMVPESQNGTWYQDGFSESKDMRSLAYRAGGGVRLASGWFLEAGYVNLGAAEIRSEFVPDHYYNAQTAECAKHCDRTYKADGQDHFQGVDLFIGKAWMPYEATRIYLKGGGAYLWHDIQLPYATPKGRHKELEAFGNVAALGAGAGACYSYLCVDVTYYRGVSETSNPFTKEFIVPMAYLRVPLATF